jgi:hypothetical protein
MLFIASSYASQLNQVAWARSTTYSAGTASHTQVGKPNASGLYYVYDQSWVLIVQNKLLLGKDIGSGLGWCSEQDFKFDRGS